MKTFDVNIRQFIPLISPVELKREIPVSDKAAETVIQSRQVIESIITRKDPRLLVISGPCSIHDEEAAREYAWRFKKLQKQVKETLYPVMRVYFEKPRTAIGWKGLINDPHLDGSHDITTGLKKARRLLNLILEMGIPTATEILDPITPQYIAGSVSWATIGARTTESQTHREMASGLSMPVGFKNGTDGDLTTALNAMIAAGSAQSFLGINPSGQTSIVRTKGNPYTHIVLRGGPRPNYDSISIREAIHMLRDKNQHEAIVVDCSHGNSHKRFEEQAVVWEDVIRQRLNGNNAIIGLMIESNLKEGCQKYNGNKDKMQYGVSITDACISWEMTEDLILFTHRQLKKPGAIKSAVFSMMEES